MIVDAAHFAPPAANSIVTSDDGSSEIPMKEVNWTKVYTFLGSELDSLGQEFKEQYPTKACESYSTFMEKAIKGGADERFGLIIASFMVKLFGKGNLRSHNY